MELICPECKGALQITQPRIARCPLHGGEFDILFDRTIESVASMSARNIAVDGKFCGAHSRQPAVAECGSCAKTLCGVCSFEVNGRHYCSDCAVSGATAPPAAISPTTAEPPAPAENQSLSAAFGSAKYCSMCGVQAALEAYKCAACGHPFGVLNLNASPLPVRAHIPADLKCPQHIECDAVAVCRSCGSGMCATCDFLLPSGLHFCPACIDNAGNEEISPKRRRLAITAIVFAAYCSLMFLFVMSGAFYKAIGSPQDVQVFGCGVLLILHAPSIAGTALAWTAFDRRFRNTPLIWTALVWNAVIFAALGVLFIVGVVT